MNPANLQMEGLLVALAALLREGSAADGAAQARVERALAEASATLASDEQRLAQLSASQQESLFFPVRFLKAALEAAPGTPPSGLIRKVGRALDREG